MFSFYLPNDDSHLGELVIGGIDTTLYTGELEYVSLSSETYWQFTMQSFTLNGASITSALEAIVDSGTSLIAGPTADVAALMKVLGGKPFTGGEVGVLPDLILTPR